jgi:hypothetical protein
MEYLASCKRSCHGAYQDSTETGRVTAELPTNAALHDT